MGLFNGLYKNYGMSKDKVLEWQSIVTGANINTVKLTKQQLLDSTQLIVDNHSRIIQDCVRLVNNTLTPGVFFDRYDMLISEMSALIKFETFYAFNKSITEQVKTLKENRVKNEIAFINKYFSSVLEAAKSLKTQKARDNRIQKFFSTMENYENRMSQEAWEQLLDLKNNR